jgi:hypothetical protein
MWHKVGSAGLALQVHSVRTRRPQVKVVRSSSLPSFFRPPPVLVARQVDKAPRIGFPVLFSIGREYPQLYNLNFGPSGLESLLLLTVPHRQYRYRLIVNRNANSKYYRYRGGCYDKCAVSALSRPVSRRVVPTYELHSAYPMLARMHSRCVVRNRLSAKIIVASQFGQLLTLERLRLQDFCKTIAEIWNPNFSVGRIKHMSKYVLTVVREKP